MNRFDVGTQRVAQGWIAYYRRVHDAQNIVLRDGPHDIVFATELEACKAANRALLDYLNTPFVGMMDIGVRQSSARMAAERKWAAEVQA